MGTNLKTSATELLGALRVTGKRWRDYKDIKAVLTQLEGEREYDVDCDDVMSLVDELLGTGLLGQRVNPEDRLCTQYVVA